MGGHLKLQICHACACLRAAGCPAWLVSWRGRPLVWRTAALGLRRGAAGGELPWVVASSVLFIAPSPPRRTCHADWPCQWARTSARAVHISSGLHRTCGTKRADRGQPPTCGRVGCRGVQIPARALSFVRPLTASNWDSQRQQELPRCQAQHRGPPPTARSKKIVFVSMRLPVVLCALCALISVAPAAALQRQAR